MNNCSRTKKISHPGIKLEPLEMKERKKKKLLRRSERNKNSIGKSLQFGGNRFDDSSSLTSESSQFSNQSNKLIEEEKVVEVESKPSKDSKTETVEEKVKSPTYFL